ncbi:MAG: hypothetical protein FJ191_00670 [Gammaproteobacteria bacterium]|nr:hypothetical protein [Gammaproteobacteria bacterium]
MAREPLHGWPRRLLHLVTLIAAPALTGAWILHNLNLYRRKGPRLGAPVVRIDYSRDWNGRAVEADWERLREASVVTVSVDGERKRYVTDRPDPTATRP